MKVRRSKFARRWSIVSAAVLILALLLVPWPNQTSGAPQTAAPFRVVIAYPNDVDALTEMDASGGTVQLGRVYDALLGLDKDLKIIPRLATSWKRIDDRTWEFKLRKGVKFHNGELFTAEDVKFGADYMMASGSPGGVRRVYASWLEGVDVVDAYTVRIRAKTPYPAVLTALIYGFILPKVYFQTVGPQEFARHPVGTGPYKIAEWRPNQFLRLEAFGKYWGGKPEVDEIVWRIIPQESTRVAALLAGEVDLILNVSPERVEELKARGMKISRRPGIDINWMGFNANVPPFDNALVRQVVVHAIDVPTMLKEIMLGYGRVANTIVQKESIGWNPSIRPYNYDPQRAQELLRQAGFPNGFRTAIHLSEALWPRHKDIAVAISGYLAKVGITADVDVREWGDYFGRYTKSQLDGMFLFGNVGYHSLEHLLLNVGSPKVGGRTTFIASSDIDAILQEARTTVDETKELVLLRRIQRILSDQAYALPLWQYDQIAAMRPRISWEVTPSRGVDLELIKKGTGQ